MDIDIEAAERGIDIDALNLDSDVSADGNDDLAPMSMPMPPGTRSLCRDASGLRSPHGTVRRGG